MKRLTIGDLDLSVIDENEADTKYIFDEVFAAEIYHHGKFALSEDSIILDVGANIGLYAIWAHRKYRPKSICCYEASPRTYACLADNIRRLIDPGITRCQAFNRAIASASGRKLILHQSTRVSGISTLLDPRTVPWIGNASAKRELETHEVTTSTVSDEIKALSSIDMLKIDVEGYFLEVLRGIADADFPKIKNIVLEVDYLPETGIRPEEAEILLQQKGYRTDCLDRSKDNGLTFYAWRE
jgi:FkbM family methyltransferase